MKICLSFFLSFLLLNGFAQHPDYSISGNAFLEIVDTSAAVQKIASGFGFLEGPVWSKEGFLLFSDLRVNKIFKLDPQNKVSVYLDKSGFSGTDATGMAKDFGSDALAFDKSGNLLVCQHGNHAIVRLTKSGSMETLVNTFEGKRLNSPDDLALKSDGSIYFTDPPYVFQKMDDDPAKAQKENGVYRYNNGKLSLLSTDYRYPNGICFSPDEKYLYICSYGNDEPVRRYEVNEDGSLKNGKLFYSENGDGLKTDSRGNIYLCNNSGVNVISPAGVMIGIIRCAEPVTNINWGESDRKTLFIVAHTGVYKVRLKIPGPVPAN